MPTAAPELLSELFHTGIYEKKIVSCARERKSEAHLVRHRLQHSGGKSAVELHDLRLIKMIIYSLRIAFVIIGASTLNVYLAGMGHRGRSASDIEGGSDKRH